MRRIAMWLMCGVGLMISQACAADAPTQPAGPTTDFAKGTFVLTLNAAYAHDFNGSEARIETGSLGLGYYFTDNISLNAEFAGFSVQQPGPDSAIAGGDLLIRQHVINSGRFSLYGDFGGGLTYANAYTPVGGTYFNFQLETGFGATWRIDDHLFLMGGVRYLHFSNAAMEGRIRNPSINAMEGYVGVMWRF